MNLQHRQSPRNLRLAATIDHSPSLLSQVVDGILKSIPGVLFNGYLPTPIENLASSLIGSPLRYLAKRVGGKSAILLVLIAYNIHLEKYGFKTYGPLLALFHTVLFLIRKVPTVLAMRLLGIGTSNPWWKAFEEITIRTIHFHGKIGDVSAPNSVLDSFGRLQATTLKMQGVYIADVPPSILGFGARERYKRPPLLSSKDVSCSAKWLTLDPEHRLGDKDVKVIIFIHGGGYAIGNASMYLMPLTNLLRRSREASGFPQSDTSAIGILSIDYPLAPNVKHPVPTEAVRYAVRSVVSRFDIKQYIVAGDSAGGAIALNVAMSESPNAIVTFSPWVAHDLSTSSHAEHAETDFIGGQQLIHSYMLSHVSTVNHSVSDQMLHLRSHEDLHKLPSRVLITVGTREVFHDDVVDFAQMLQNEGISVTMVEGKDSPHIFPMLYPLFHSESSRALDSCAKFIAEVFWGPPVQEVVRHRKLLKSSPIADELHEDDGEISSVSISDE